MSKAKKKARLKRKRSKDRAEKRARRHPVLEKKTGKITVTPGGFGFVIPDDGEKDVFIPPKYIEGAMDGDKVEIGIIEEPRRSDAPTKGPAGKVINILERARTTVVGELLAGKKVRPLNKRLTDDIQISGVIAGAKRGDWVKVELLHGGDLRDGERRGTIKKGLGKVGSIESDLQAIISEYNLPSPYSEEANEEAGKLKPREIERKDLTDLFCVTIDPIDAKDYDDAVSLAPGKNEDEVILGVHIADVAAWIERGSGWDKAAQKRSFTAYLPGKTMPMLPRTLTALISLNPEKDCPAHTVLMTVNKKSGKILSSERCHSMIRVKKRLTFDGVQEFIDTGKAPEDWDEKFIANMNSIVELARQMRSFRKKHEKFLELTTTEIRVICDEELQKVTGLVRKEQREADQLVEDCMLAANSEVAKEMIARQLPGVFRVHPEPSPEKLEEFCIFMAKTFNIYPGDLTSRKACNQFLSNLEDDEKKPVIIGAFLRSLPRAYYLENNELHFGLGKERYSHFTSPIRRYPDLLVHQQLWAADTHGQLMSKNRMGELAADCSQKEMNNDEAWYAANDRLKLHYLEQLTGDGTSPLYEGIIAKITSGGLLVDIAELGIYGFVPVEMLSGTFRYRKSEQKLTSSRGHNQYKCGDYIYLRLDRIDFIRGTAIFRPVDY